MKPKTRVILEMATEAGVKRGYRLAHKYDDNPLEGVITDRISETVMGEIYEYFTFDDELG